MTVLPTGHGAGGPPRSVIVPPGPFNGHCEVGVVEGEAGEPNTAAAAQAAAGGPTHLSAPNTPGIGPVFSQRRRRSSWAAGEWPSSQSEGGDRPAAGLEALSPADLYRHFIAIRDAMLRKPAAAGGGGKAAPAAAERGEAEPTDPDRDPCASPVTGGPISGNTLPASGCGGGGGGGGAAAEAGGGCARSARRHASDYTGSPSPSPSPPVHSPHRLSNATYADPQLDGVDPALVAAAYSPRCSPVGPAHGAPHLAFSSDPHHCCQPRHPSQSQEEEQRPQHQQHHQQQQSPRLDAAGSPVIIDLQHFYHSPTPSSGGRDATGACSPFQGAVAYASDAVAYNALYAGVGPGAGPKTAAAATTPPPPPGGEGEGSTGEAGAGQELGPAVGEDGGSIPATDSLFSLQPSLMYTTNEASLQQQQQHEQQLQESVEVCDGGGCNGGGAAKMLVWQEDMTAVVGSADADSCAGGGGEVRLSEQGSGVVVHGLGTAQGGAAPSGDYESALQSAAAKRLLLPLPGLPGLPSGGSGAHGASQRHASDSGPAQGGTPISGVLPRERVEEVAASPFTSYLPLPLPGLPPPCGQADAGPASPSSAAGAAGAKPPVLPTSPSMVAAAAEAVRKCLDKGIPFAAMTAERFAAVVAAAEAHDSPLALHILTTHCAYYPGTGRHAASAGGVALDGSPGGSSSGAGSPVAASGASGSGGGLLLGRRPATAAAAAAAAAVRKLLDGGEPLHVMSPCEYQRIALAAQYGVRQLHDMLIAVPLPPTAAAAAHDAGSSSDADAATPRAAAAAAAFGRALPAMPPLAGSMGRRGHRRGGSIGSEGSFTATVVRFTSTSNAAAEAPPAGAASPRAAGVRSVPAASAPAVSVQAGTQVTDAAGRLRALVQAAQHGNAARVAYLVARGADVNATEGAAQHPRLLQTQPPPAAQTQPQLPPSCALSAPSLAGGGGSGSGAINGSGGGGVMGRTALHYAAEAGSFAVVQLLLHYGAFVGVRDSTGRTAHELARRKGHEAVAQLLKDAAERRREVVRSGSAQGRGAGGAGGAGPGAVKDGAGAAAGARGGLALPALASLVTPRSAKEQNGGGAASGAGAAQVAPLSPRQAAPGQGAGGAAGPDTSASSVAEARPPSATAASARSAGSDSSSAAPRPPLSRFSKEAAAAAAPAAVATSARVSPAARVASAAAAVVKPSDASGVEAAPSVSPAVKAGQEGAAAAPLDDGRPSKQRGGKRGVFACFGCGA